MSATNSMRTVVLLLLLVTGVLPIPSQAQPRLSVALRGTDAIRFSWEDADGIFELEQAPALGAGAAWRRVTQPSEAEGISRAVTLPLSSRALFFRLRSVGAQLTRVLSTSPASGESGVAVTRETIFRFSSPLAAGTTLTGANLFAEFGGRRLLSRAELSSDRRTATLFYLEDLPGGARVRVTLRGPGLADAAGADLDADGDGRPGGESRVNFETLGIAALPKTAVVGRVLASERNADGSNRPLAGVTITVDGAEERLRAITGDDGFFRLAPCPAGRFFVHVDGRTAVDGQWPGGAYYPVVGKAWEAIPGRTNNLAGGSGEIFLPLVPGDSLRTVSAAEETTIAFSPSLIASNPALAGVQVRVPANALFADSGVRGGRVGIAPVAPDRLPEPLPPGLNLPLVITIQTDGPLNFDRPAPVRFPNLPDPSTGRKLPPGAKTVLWSFNHDTGRWEAQGTATITADGNFAETDPGVGARQPGWHGVTPDTEPEPEPDPPPPDPPRPDPPDNDEDEDPCNGMVGVYDCDEDGCAETFEPCQEDCEEKKRQIQLHQSACPESRVLDNTLEDFFWCPILGDCPDPAWKDKFAACRELLEDAMYEYHKCLAIGGLAASRNGSDGVAKLGAAAGQILADQRLLIQAASHPLNLLFGTTAFAELEPEEFELGQALIEAITAAADPLGPSGPSITVEERGGVHALARPDGLAPAVIDTALDRLGALASGSLPSAEFRAILDAMAAYRALYEQFQARGWRTPMDGFHALEARRSQVVKTKAGETFFPRRRLYFRIVNLENGFEIRNRLNARGHFEGLALPPETYLRIEYLDPVTRAAGGAVFRTSAAGDATKIPAAIMFSTEDEPDADGDQLADAVEIIVGTNPGAADTDGDGIPDGSEFREGLDPLDGISVVTGPVAAVGTPGSPKHLAVDGTVLIIADGSAGLALVDVSRPRRPLLLNRLNLRGRARYVAADDGFVAVAEELGGAAVADIRDPARPIVLWDRRPDPAIASITATGIRGRTVLAAAENGTLYVLDRDTGALRQAIPIPFGFATTRTDELRIVGDVAYLLSEQRWELVNPGALATFLIDGDFVFPLGRASAAPFAWRSGSQIRRPMAVESGRAFYGYFQGFAAIDVANPALPGEAVSPPRGTQPGGVAAAGNGSGLLLGLTVEGEPFQFSLKAYDVRGPGAPTSVLLSIPLSDPPEAIAVANGHAFIVDNSTGLLAVNYVGPDTRGAPPTLEPKVHIFRHDATPEGVRWRIDAGASDDLQVRQVEAFLGTARVAHDASPPFELNVRAPGPGAGAPIAVRLVATDMGGNVTVREAPLVDRAPPRIVSLHPSPGGQHPESSLVAIAVEFDEPLLPSSLRPVSLVLTNTGRDQRLGTADDAPVLLGDLRLENGGRTLIGPLTSNLPRGNYAVALEAGLADEGANARPYKAGWGFDVAASAMSIRAVTPTAEVAVPGGAFPPLLVELTQPIRPEDAAGFTIVFTAAGPDGRVNTADDAAAGAGAPAWIGATTIQVAPPAGLLPGLYQYAISSPLLGPGSYTRQLRFRNAPNEWIAASGGVWSRGANWSQGGVFQGDALRIPSLGTHATTNDLDAALTSIESDAPFVLARELNVARGARFNGLFKVVPGALMLQGGPYDLLGGVEFISSPFQNSSFALGPVELTTRGLTLWQEGQIRITSPDAIWRNAAGGVVRIGANASELRLIGSLGGRFLNFGRIEKPEGANAVSMDGMRMLNDGEIVIGSGQLRFLDYEGAGRVEIAGGAAAAFRGAVRVAGGSVLAGSGRVDLESVDARFDGEYLVEGVTRLGSGSAYFPRGVRVSNASFEMFASLRETLRFGAPSVLGSLTARTGETRFDAPSAVSRMTVNGGVVTGNGPLQVGALTWENGGGFGAAISVAVSNKLLFPRGTTVRVSDGSTVRIAAGASVQFEGAGSPRFVYENNPGLIINESEIQIPNGITMGIETLFENRGRLLIRGGIVRVGASSTLVQASLAQTPGAETVLDGGELHLGFFRYRHAAGVIGGAGVIGRAFRSSMEFNNAAVVRAGNPAGALTLTGVQLVQDPAGEILISLGPEGPSRLEVTGSGAQTRLAGRLRVELLPGAAPEIGQTWDIITSPSLQREFAELVLPEIGAGKRLAVSYAQGKVVLSVAPQ